MKILHISTYQKGGAGIAATRLHQSLLKAGYDSKLLILTGKESEKVVVYNKTNFINYLFKIATDKLGIPLTLKQRNDYKIRKHKRKFELFSFATTTFTRLHEHPLVLDADIINLHWVANFVDYSTFFRSVTKPVVWTLHDMYPFQGGFHYQEDELLYAKALNGYDEKQYIVKLKALVQKNPEALTIVTPSKWLLQLSKHSRILGKFPHTLIPYGINTDIFRLQNREECKAGLGLPKDKVIVLFVAENLNNYRKGFDMVLNLIRDETVGTGCSFIAVGNVKKADRIPQIKYIGTVKDEVEMSKLYNAADIFILPSREDNLPFTMIESLCCGTPVAGFSIGGLKESVTNFQNGILADDVSVSGLTNALNSCISNIDRFNRTNISLTAQAKYASEIQVKEYANLYNTCLHADLAHAGNRNHLLNISSIL